MSAPPRPAGFSPCPCCCRRRRCCCFATVLLLPRGLPTPPLGFNAAAAFAAGERFFSAAAAVPEISLKRETRRVVPAAGTVARFAAAAGAPCRPAAAAAGDAGLPSCVLGCRCSERERP